MTEKEGVRYFLFTCSMTEYLKNPEIYKKYDKYCVKNESDTWSVYLKSSYM